MNLAKNSFWATRPIFKVEKEDVLVLISKSVNVEKIDRKTPAALPYLTHGGKVSPL
jgi:hypothetical protein